MVVLAKVIRDWFDLLARHVRRLPSLTSSSAASSTSRAKRCTYHGKLMYTLWALQLVLSWQVEFCSSSAHSLGRLC